MGEITDKLVEKRVQDAVEKAVHECKVDIAKKLIANENLTIEEVADYSGLSVEEVRELQAQFEADKTGDA